MIKKLTDLFFQFLALLMILALASMALMVFVNVVLRYGMNSGIAISDEMSRYFFVWLNGRFGGPRILERHSTVEYRRAGLRIDAVGNEIAVALELEAVFRFDVSQCRFKLCSDNTLGFRIDIR